jgi:hypothetical protein
VALAGAGPSRRARLRDQEQRCQAGRDERRDKDRPA